VNLRDILWVSLTIVLLPETFTFPDTNWYNVENEFMAIFRCCFFTFVIAYIYFNSGTRHTNLYYNILAGYITVQL